MAKHTYPGVTKADRGNYKLMITISLPSGQRKYYRYTVKAKSGAEASRIREQLREELLSGQKPKTKFPTLGDFATLWLRSKANEIASSTLHTYSWGLDNLRELGSLPIDKITPMDVKQWRDSFSGVSSVTVNNHLRVIKTLIGDACDEFNLPNPVTRVKSIRENKQHDDPNLLSKTELRTVLSTAKETEPQWYPLFATLALTGTRFGECSALQWRDIAFEKSTITIQRAQWRGELKDTKTGSIRIVPMPELLRSVLHYHYHEQGEPSPESLVFPSQAGTFLKNGSGIGKPWTKILKVAGITHHVTIHGLRRTYNNLMRQVTGSLVVQSLTGHSSDGMTAHYSHVGLDEKHKAITKLDQLLR